MNFGDYTLKREVGKGLLGTVYLAEHRFLRKPFALKIFSKEVADDPLFYEHFEREISLAFSIDHPHFVKVHNASCIDGQPYVSMDYVNYFGEETLNLSQMLAKREIKLAEDEVIEILSQIASALDFLHMEASYLNLKPSNILLRKKDSELQVILSDIGLPRLMGIQKHVARSLKSIGEEFLQGTKSSPYLETMAFMSPEQRLGSELSDFRSDVYSFGVLAYYLLTKELPEGIFPKAPDRWNHLVEQCLQKDPHKRPRELKHLIDTLFATTLFDLPKPLLKEGELHKPQFDPDPASAFHVDKTVSRYQPNTQEEKAASPILTEMVVIRGGTFWRGSNSGSRDEMPQHQINLGSFAIDIHPVTNEQFVRFLEAMGGEKDETNNDIIRLKDSRVKRSAGKLVIESGYAKHPVVGVTWFGALAYAKWVGKRLPTEAEWEVAACGGLESPLYSTGPDIEKAEANFFSSDTTAVMSYPPNGYGLYDVVGNVYEWCQDWYAYNYYSISMQEPNNPKGPATGVYRILRGGCWKSLKEDLRCSHRHRNNPGSVNATYGFRCATDVA